MLSADDKYAIIETISRYNNASDRRDVEAHIAAYAPGGRIVSAMGSTEGGIEGLRGALPLMFAAEGTAKRHLPSNHEFDQTDDDHVTVSYLLTVLEAETAPQVVATAWITDHFQRTGQGWRVGEHQISIDPSYAVPAA